MACVYWQYVNTSRGTVNMYLHSIGIHRPSPDASIIIIYVYKCYPLPRYRFHNISQCINVQKKPSPSPTSCPQIGRWSRCTKVTLGSRNMNSSDSYEHLEIDDKNLLVYIQSIRSSISIYELLKYTRTPVSSYPAWNHLMVWLLFQGCVEQVLRVNLMS